MYSLILISLLVASTFGASAAIEPENGASETVINVDVAVLGGGASGAHAAFVLREDFNKTVVLVEKQGRLVRRLTRDQL